MGIGDPSALPDHIDEPHEWDGKDDDDHWYTKWRKGIKPWFAFGPRSPKGIAFSPFPPFVLKRKWRDVPKVLWAKKGNGFWRFEADGEPDLWTYDDDPRPFLKDHPGYYLSRNQYWCVWHKALLWPAFLSAHKYDDPKDVIPVGERGDRDGKIWLLYALCKRDADRIFWFPALYFGRNYK